MKVEAMGAFLLGTGTQFLAFVSGWSVHLLTTFPEAPRMAGRFPWGGT